MLHRSPLKTVLPLLLGLAPLSPALALAQPKPEAAQPKPEATQPKPEAKPAAAALKAQTLELVVFLHDKPVGTEVMRTTQGQEGVYYSTEATLQDKVRKVWRSFKQRAHLQMTLKGEVTSYDRWIDVTGATSQTKLFQFEGKWRVAVTEAAFEGKKPKPKVTEVQAQRPLVVLDERLPSLVAVAVERMAGRSEFDYVRMDNATAGHVTMTSEALVDKAGRKFHRIRLKGPSLDVSVLRDSAGKPLAIQGVDGWRAVVKDAKVPKDLTPEAAPPADPPAAADLPKAATPTP